MRILLIVTFVLFSAGLKAQVKPQVYDPEADAQAAVAEAVEKARASHKHVILFIGGNWCPWCVRLNGFIFDNQELDSLIQAHYQVVKVNYSKENKNLQLLKTLGVPQRFGFPVIVILDDEGNRLHTQNTLFLEKDKSYDEKRIQEFLLGWTSEAIRPENHKDYR